MGRWMVVPGLVLTVGVMRAEQGLHALTLAAIMAAGFTLGCLLLALLQHMVHALWGILLIDRFEAGGGPWSIAVVAIALLPTWLHPESTYVWTQGGFPEKAWWLSVGFFRFRSVLYLAAWALLAAMVRRATLRGNYATNVAAPGFFFVCVTGTFAAFDWAMSLEPSFTSTVYGMLFLAGSILGAMGACVALLCASERSDRFDRPLRRDYGNLLFTMLMVWAYLGFTQYLICWSGNLRDEVAYFVRRDEGGWLLLGNGMVAIGFFAPFFLLLTPRVRDSRTGLGLVGAFVVVVWASFMVWLVGPALAAPWWLHASAVIGVALMLAGAFAHQMSVRSTNKEFAIA